MRKQASKIVLSLLAGTLLFTQSAQPALAWGWGNWGHDWDDPYPHGTVDYTIAEHMVDNTPDPDYEVNPETQADAKYGLYNEYFLEDAIQTVRINIDENNLNYLFQNAIDEPYVMTDEVTIGDATLSYCGLRTKGNYTLAHAVTDNPGSDRFSFTINFGKFIKKADYGQKQNFYGCDKISFNNFFFDKSMMKEFFSLKLMDEMGLPTPQYGLAKLYINDDYYGVYAMVEAMDTPILEQYFDCDSGDLSDYLTKPTGTQFIYEDLLEDQAPLWEFDEDTYTDVERMLPTVMEWVRRINCLSEGTDFDGAELDVNSQEYLDLMKQVLNVDEVVRYFAVHSWLCQMDNMFMCEQNFGLYISEDGVCTMVPWDYDLSFGCYFPSTAQTTANYPIDIMYSISEHDWGRAEETAERIYGEHPLFNIIYQNDELMEKYHGYMKDCSRVAALGGTVEATGKTYDPGFFYSFIERMEDEIINAASEELAENVYYMNRIEQPGDVKKGLPNLAKIIAMRSVGVLLQVEEMDSEVCAVGCNLETLGNASQGRVPSSGRLTLVDESTGIFVTADYADGNRVPPGLTVTELTEDYTEYDQIKSLVFDLPLDTIVAYELKSGVDPESEYTVTIPMAADHMTAGSVREFYAYSDGWLHPVSVDSDGNLFTYEVDSLEYVVVIVRPLISVVIIAAVVLIVLAAITLAIVLPIRHSKKKKALQSEAQGNSAKEKEDENNVHQ